VFRLMVTALGWYKKIVSKKKVVRGSDTRVAVSYGGAVGFSRDV